MLSAFYKKIASLCSGFKQIFTSWLKSIGISEAFSAQLKALEKILGVLVKILLYSLIPLFLIVILTIIFFSFVFRNTYKGVFYCIRGFDTAIAFFKKKILSLENFLKNVLRRAKEFTANFKSKVINHHGEQRNIFRRILSVLSKMFLYALVPPLFIFLLIIILLSKVMPYVNRWIAYGITTLKAILVIIGETRSADDAELDETIEFTGFKYDSEQDIFYSDLDPWQKKFGYCRLYDEAAAPWGMIVDSEPIYFEYSGKKWLIEFWKGQYDLSTGCEIGVYTTEGPSLDIPGVFNGTFYKSASNEDQLQVSCCLKKNNQKLFIREDYHWWLTGFKVGEFSKPKELSMDITITLKDEAMLNVFINGLKKAGYLDEQLEINQNTVTFKFDKPKTPQPFTRTRLTDWMIQRKNKLLCKKFQNLTGSQNTTLEKLEIIKQKSPKLYSKIINIGRNINLYNKCRVINDYLK